MVDTSFINKIYSEMEGYEFYGTKLTAEIENGGIVVVRKQAHLKKKKVEYSALTISLDWSRCVKDTKAPDDNTENPLQNRKRRSIWIPAMAEP